MSTITIRRTVATLALLAVALPAGAADCGPAAWTNNTDATVTVAVQMGEGYEEVDVAVGGSIEYWTAEPGDHWAVWLLPDFAVVAQGVQCGVAFVAPETPVPVESPDEPVLSTPAEPEVPVVPSVEPEPITPEPITPESVAPIERAEPVTPVAPLLPVGVYAY